MYDLFVQALETGRKAGGCELSWFVSQQETYINTTNYDVHSSDFLKFKIR
jgi:hypothetical protein